jgi:hypothetical protein
MEKRGSELVELGRGLARARVGVPLRHTAARLSSRVLPTAVTSDGPDSLHPPPHNHHHHAAAAQPARCPLSALRPPPPPPPRSAPSVNGADPLDKVLLLRAACCGLRGFRDLGLLRSAHRTQTLTTTGDDGL